MSSAVFQSLRARERASARRAEIREQVYDQEALRRRSLGANYVETSVETIVDRWTGKDPEWQGAAKDNQWYLMQTTAYGTARLVEQNEQIIMLLQQIATAVTR